MWTKDVPRCGGWYWAKRNMKELPHINNEPRIVFVGCDLMVREGVHDYGHHVSELGFAFWSGPIEPPAADETVYDRIERYRVSHSLSHSDIEKFFRDGCDDNGAWEYST